MQSGASVTPSSWCASACISHLYNISQNNTTPRALYTIVCLETN